MSNLTPQTISLLLSLLGIVVLLACLIMIALNKIPELSVPQKLKGFGLDLNISVVTLLVLVGLVLALTSTFLQVRNYDSALAAAEKKAEALDAALSQAKKMNLNADITLAGVNPDQPEDISLEDLKCRYYIDSPDTAPGWVEDAKLTPGVHGTAFVLTLEEITPKSRVERIEVIDKNPKHPRKWSLADVGTVLRPAYKLRKG
jgi:hypothetical protein